MRTDHLASRGVVLAALIAAPHLGAQSLAERVAAVTGGQRDNDVRCPSRCLRRWCRRRRVRPADHRLSIDAWSWALQ